MEDRFTTGLELPPTTEFQVVAFLSDCGCKEESEGAFISIQTSSVSGTSEFFKL